jgi:universal stress protein E
MVKLKRILLIAPSERVRTPAFDRAHALASATGALLHIVAFDYIQSLAVAGLFDHDAMAQAREGYLQVHRQWLEQQARFHRCVGLPVTTEVVWARNSLAHVLAYVNDFHPDLVIKDTQHVPALDRAFHRPLDWLLLRDCPAHLHLVTGAKNPKPLKILAAVDLSHLEEMTQGLNDRILDFAATLSASCGAALHLLNVNSWSVTGDSVASLPTPRWMPVCETQSTMRSKRRSMNWPSATGLNKNAGIWRRESPHRVITRVAREHAFDIVVLGTAYTHGIDRFIGSTAESVLNKAPCSLVVVKPLPWLD